MKTVWDNTFEKGHDGWSGLPGGANTRGYYPQLSPVSVTGPNSLLIDTRGEATNVLAIAAKRWYAHLGVIEWFTRFGWNAGPQSAVGGNSLLELRWSLDWQLGQDRRWWECRYRHYSQGLAQIYPQWDFTTGNAAAVATCPTMPAPFYELGYNNPTRVDFHEITLRFDTRRRGWLSITLDGTTHSLASIPTTGTMVPEVPFANGANCLFYVRNRTDIANADPYMVVDQTTLKVG